MVRLRNLLLGRALVMVRVMVSTRGWFGSRPSVGSGQTALVLGSCPSYFHH